MTIIRMTVLILFLILMSFSRPAYAYLDLGSGSYAFQLVMAGGITALYFLKSWWKKPATLIQKWFSGKKSDAGKKP